MTARQLLTRLKPESVIFIKGQPFKILQHIVWWQAKCNENYDKYVLEDQTGNHGYRLSISGDDIGMSTIFHHEFVEPMPQKLIYKGKEYELTQNEFCIVRQTEGQDFYKVGDAEIWWDYALSDGSGKGLSLGRNWTTWEREDLKTEALNPDDISFN